MPLAGSPAKRRSLAGLVRSEAQQLRSQLDHAREELAAAVARARQSDSARGQVVLELRDVRTRADRWQKHSTNVSVDQPQTVSPRHRCALQPARRTRSAR